LNDELFLRFFLFLNKLVITKAKALVSITTPIETTNIPTCLNKLTKVEIIEKEFAVNFGVVRHQPPLLTMLLSYTSCDVNGCHLQLSYNPDRCVKSISNGAQYVTADSKISCDKVKMCRFSLEN
jgi:hypothetical protein